ncbi:hypothetical protein X474_20800 [Dethiosulfatarculus sandiegensis]|uniref:Uncharacterized protein n=1 Tax=Dethiosulfatarculus sandiegensis TaxID=1429043 RepID=A0A0D2J9F0_9BACT|nr:hypothetical protein X474_20800 [Dethiosulfatarculus sandiegensis]
MFLRLPAFLGESRAGLARLSLLIKSSRIWSDAAWQKRGFSKRLELLTLGKARNLAVHKPRP